MADPDSVSAFSKDIEEESGVVVSELPTVPPGNNDVGQEKPPKPKRGAGFWLIFLAICLSIMLSAIDLTAIPTALPSIVADLGGETSFAWVGNAYTLAAAAWLPLSGAMASVFGRKPIVILALVLFFIGSALCGEARSMSMLIAGRTVQGLGNGGITALAEIVISDLIPLKERGLFMGLTSLTWAFASSMGPPVAGAFSEKVSWRWIFRINLPLTFLAFCFVMAFLKLKMPAGTLMQKLRRIDWLGNVLVAAATCSVTIALTRGGVAAPWTSAQTLVPLVLGLLGLIGFFVFEAMWPTEPTIPFDLLTNRTSVSGYLCTFFHSIVATAVIFFMAIYFQACLGASTIRSGVDNLSLALTIAPSAVVGGVSAAVLKRYVPQNWIGWALICLSTGLMSLLRPETPTARWVGFQVLSGMGLGIVWTAVKFSVLAPVPVTRNASAMALFTFSRTFAQTFGITIGSAVLQNQLKTSLPADFIARFPGNVDVSFAAIPYISTLPEVLQRQVRNAFADSLSVLWKVMLAFCFMGLLATMLMKEIELHAHTDENWDMSEMPKGTSVSGSHQHVALSVQKTSAPSEAVEAGGEVLVIGRTYPV